MCGMTQVMAQKSITKEAKKVEREIKKQERLAQDAVEGQEEFNAAVQAINNQSFVLEANNIQPMNTGILRKFKYELRIFEWRTGYGPDRVQLSVSRS